MEQTKKLMLSRIVSLREHILRANLIIKKAQRAGYGVVVDEITSLNVTRNLTIRKYSRDYAIHHKATSISYRSLAEQITLINAELKRFEEMGLEVELYAGDRAGSMEIYIVEIRVRIHDFKKGE